MINYNQDMRHIGLKRVTMDFTSFPLVGSRIRSDVVYEDSKFQEVYILDFTDMYSSMSDTTSIELEAWYLRGEDYEYTRRNFNSVNNYDKTVITKEFLANNKILQFVGADIRRDKPNNLVFTKLTSGLSARLLAGPIPSGSPVITTWYDKKDNSWLRNHN